MKIQTVYKVVTSDLRSVVSVFPNWSLKDYIIQYSTQNWVCGRDNTKIFCFMELERAQRFIGCQKYGGLDIWEAKAFNLKEKRNVLRVNYEFSLNRFVKFWNNLLPSNFSGCRRIKPNRYFVCDKLILVKKIS